MIRAGFVVLASVLAVSATKSLTVKVTAPLVVDNVDTFDVITSVINTGDETVTLLNDPRGPLSTWATNTFAVSNTDGATPDFTGVHVRYIPEVIATEAASLATSLVSDSRVTVLGPGQSVEVSHEAGRYYNFTSSGKGLYTFEPVNIFNTISTDESGALETIIADTIPAKVRLSGKLASGKALKPTSIGGSLQASEPPKLEKRASFVGCSSTRTSQTNSAISAGGSYANRAASHLSSNPSGSSLQTTWFGTFSSSRHSSLLSGYRNLVSTPGGWTYDCSTCASDTGTYAYVYRSRYGQVFLCGYFWIAPATGSGSRADTIVHEGSHFTQIKGTEDYAYGESACRSLASRNPAQAANNADNMAFFSVYA